MQTYGEKEQAKQEKLQNAQFEKRNTRKYDGAKSCAHRDKKLKENLDPKWDKGNGGLKLRLQTAKYPICEN